MTHSVAYELGKHQGLRRQPMCKFFTPTGCWEDTQYKQGYIDGSFELQKDIENDQQNRHRRLVRTTSA